MLFTAKAAYCYEPTDGRQCDTVMSKCGPVPNVRCRQSPVHYENFTMAGQAYPDVHRDRFQREPTVDLRTERQNDRRETKTRSKAHLRLYSCIALLASTFLLTFHPPLLMRRMVRSPSL